MSENSPRWPSASGASGLDFSPHRAPSDAPAPASPAVPVINGDGPTHASSAPSSGTPASPTSGPSFSPAPVNAPSEPASAAPQAEAADQTRTIPAVAGRAARVAQEWAAKAKVAVTPKPAAAPGEGPGVPGGSPGAVTTPSRTATFVPVASTLPAEAEARTAHPSRRTRKARLRLSRIDPWSVMKTAFLFSIAFGVMMVVAAFMLWSVLAGSGALESANTFINTLIGDQDTAFNIGDFLSASRVLGFATVVAAVDVVIITAVATLFAFLYNLAATVMGGLEITLAED